MKRQTGKAARSFVATAAALGALALLAGESSAADLTSASFLLRGGTLSGGGEIALQSTAPTTTIGSAGVTIGQPGPIGISAGSASGITLHAGFWPIMASAAAPQDSDGDGIGDLGDNCPLIWNADQADQDADEVGDLCDNCVEDPNPRDIGGGMSATFTGNQLDSDADGYGNACDGDFNQSLPIIGFPDLAQIRQAMGKDRDSSECPNDDGSTGGPCDEFDLDGSLPIIGFPDLARFRSMIGQPPGPKCDECPLPNLD